MLFLVVRGGGGEHQHVLPNLITICVSLPLIIDTLSLLLIASIKFSDLAVRKTSVYDVIDVLRARVLARARMHT